MIGANRQIVEMWLWIEVSMLFGSKFRNQGHHYFGLGTPEYWWEIGALFSARTCTISCNVCTCMYDWEKKGYKETKMESS